MENPCKAPPPPSPSPSHAYRSRPARVARRPTVLLIFLALTGTFLGSEHGSHTPKQLVTDRSAFLTGHVLASGSAVLGIATGLLWPVLAGRRRAWATPFVGIVIWLAALIGGGVLMGHGSRQRTPEEMGDIPPATRPADVGKSAAGPDSSMPQVR